MQRKNSILRATHKEGIAMIMAIAVIVIIATIMALALSMTTHTSKKTSDLYLYEQAEILSRSAAEYGVLRATLVNPCTLGKINFAYNNTFDINISMQYVSFSGSACDSNAVANGVKYGTTTASESDGTIIMDITVSSQDGVASEPVRYFRRSVQKL